MNEKVQSALRELKLKVQEVMLYKKQLEKEKAQLQQELEKLKQNLSKSELEVNNLSTKLQAERTSKTLEGTDDKSSMKLEKEIEQYIKLIDQSLAKVQNNLWLDGCNPR